MGLGAYPGSDRQFLGMLGMHGFYEANMAMHHSDVILAVGARFDDRVTNTVSKFCPGAKIIHVDIDPASIAKIVPVDIPIVGPVDTILEELDKQVALQMESAERALNTCGWLLPSTSSRPVSVSCSNDRASSCRPVSCKSCPS